MGTVWDNVKTLAQDPWGYLRAFGTNYQEQATSIASGVSSGVVNAAKNAAGGSPGGFTLASEAFKTLYQDPGGYVSAFGSNAREEYTDAARIVSETATAGLAQVNRAQNTVRLVAVVVALGFVVYLFGGQIRTWGK